MDNADNARTARILEALSACRTTLRAFIRRRIPQREDVDDILQDVTLQLINVEQPVENVSAWLFRAARNEMIDRGRKKREWLLGDDEEADDQLYDVLFGEVQTPEEARLKEIFWEELESALAALPAAQREVFEKPNWKIIVSKPFPLRRGCPFRPCCRASTKRYAICESAFPRFITTSCCPRLIPKNPRHRAGVAGIIICLR
jgi:RNA polymerase sigma factor (sigma-70 family)